MPLYQVTNGTSSVVALPLWAPHNHDQELTRCRQVPVPLASWDPAHLQRDASPICVPVLWERVRQATYLDGLAWARGMVCERRFR